LGTKLKLCYICNSRLKYSVIDTMHNIIISSIAPQHSSLHNVDIQETLIQLLLFDYDASYPVSPCECEFDHQRVFHYGQSWRNVRKHGQHVSVFLILSFMIDSF
jgi:hypothetical protein